MVKVYDPVRAALSNVPINDTSLWPTINSSSNTVVELKAELVERKLVSSNQFTLTVQQGAHWMDESENMRWPDGTILCVRVEPHGMGWDSAIPFRTPSEIERRTVKRKTD
jgi:hypothetical protein